MRQGHNALSITPNVPRGRRVALYYPHVHFRSREWLRAALLYYDQLSRIVPAGLNVDTKSFYEDFLGDESGSMLEDISALKASGFLIEDAPEPHVSSVAADFHDFAERNLKSPKQRASLVPELSRRKSFYTIHPAKIDRNLSKTLAKLKLVHTRQGDYYSDLDIEPVTGGLYMLFLANRMAGRRNLVSDSAVYQSLMYQKVPRAATVKSGRRDQEFRLATAVLKTAIPTTLELIPLDRLLRLREDLGKQRTRFQDKIAALARALEQIENQEDLQEAIETHQRKVEDEYQELVDKLRSANLSFFTGLYAVSVPTWATATWGMGIVSMTPLLAGLGALAVSGVVVKSIFDRKAVKGSNPLTYLLSVRKGLAVKSTARRITTLSLKAPGDDDDIEFEGGGSGSGRIGRVFR